MPTLAYCATLNNYTADDVATLKNGHDKIEYLLVGHEVGEEGTPHLQIYFQLNSQVKFSTIKKWGGPWSRMHFEKSRGSDEDNYRYCTKDNSFWELGEKRTMPGKGARMDLVALKNDIDKGMQYDDICDTHFEASMKYFRFIKERIQVRATKLELSSLLAAYEGVVWKPWQQQLLDMVSDEPDDRTITWVWEPTGKVGKTFLANYLMASGKATLLEAGKKTDLAYIMSLDLKETVVIDLTRTTEDHMGGLYSLAEDLKSRRMLSPKYESRMMIFGKKHVIFFANFKPDMKAWSADRYNIIEVV